MKMRWPGLRKNSKKNAVKAEVVEDSEEHKNAAKSDVVETLDTQTPLKKKNEKWRGQA